ncbi:MAG: hypothetical protein GTO40_14325, partial [Deltaproteobacteria bacterium]|nr:hypothetical protein [Deltaproteobacteria bacterium]
KGRVVLEPVTLDKIKNVPVVESYLPAQLTSKGPIGIVSDIQGSLQDLKVNTSIMADESDVGFGNWLKKPKGVPAKIVVRIAHKNDRTTLDQSTLSLYNLNMDVSGSMEKSPERLLRLRVRTDAVKLDGWDKLLPRVSNYELKGEAGFNLAINTMQSPQGDNVDIRGLLSLNKVSIKDRKTGRRVDQIASKVIFKGKEAEVEKLQIKLGSSNFTVQGVLENFSSPMFRYRLSSSKVNLADLTQRPEYKSDWAKGITSEGELRLADGTPTVEAEITLAEGSLQELPYKNLNGIIAWRPDKLGIEDLNFQALGGDFQGNGSWTLGNGKNP